MKFKYLAVGVVLLIVVYHKSIKDFDEILIGSA